MNDPLLSYDWPDTKKLKPGFNDINSDGKIDSLLFNWNGKTTVFISDDGELPFMSYDENTDWNEFFNRAFNVNKNFMSPWNDMRKSWGNYTVLVDRNNCGRFDTADDFCYRVFDLNHDGAPEAEYYNLFPGNPEFPFSNKIHFNLNGEHDMSYLDFYNHTYADEQFYTEGSKYIMNVHGSGFFLNSYSPKPIKAWENPIAWYDFDFDGRTNMVMRCADCIRDKHLNYSGLLHEFEIAFEVNGNTTPQKYHSLDFQLTFYNYGCSTFDYTNMSDTFEFIKPLTGSEYLSERIADTRFETQREYIPYMDGYNACFAHKSWSGVFLLFDEDDDDCRWEEMFSNHEGTDPENTDSNWHGYSDRIGDRTENDIDFEGKGQLYIGKFDGRLHLYHAECCWWEIDYLSLYKGSMDRKNLPEGPEPPEGLIYPRVRYYDTNGNGFINKIVYELVEYKHEREHQTIINTINLLDYADNINPSPDHCELFDMSVNVPNTGWNIQKWNGEPLTSNDFKNTPVKAGYNKACGIYDKICNEMWENANMLYSTAKRYNFNRSESLDAELKTDYTREELASMKVYEIPKGYSRHLKGETRREKYNNGFWLREKVFADILSYSGLDKFTLEKYYYTGRLSELCNYINFNMKGGF